jgi:hypothetical protein
MSKEVYPGGSFGATRAGTADSNTVQHPPAQGDDMQPGEALYADQSIWSTNGRSRFIYQLDGNLVLYGPGGPRWASRTTGRIPGVCIMQTDGNLVMSGPGGVYIWDSNTHNNPGSRLLVQDDGNVVIYRPNGVPIWQTSGPTSQRVRLTLSRRFDISSYTHSYTHSGLLNISSGKVKV